MSLRNWREWFVPEEENTPSLEEETAIRNVSGAGHQGEEQTLKLKKQTPPRCAACKRFIGFETGLHLIISQDWRIHVSCFSSVLERHYQNGEVINLSTGEICRVDPEPEPVEPQVEVAKV